MTITLAQKAWMAGVLETRGKIRFTNNRDRKTNQLVVQLRSSHIALVERMCELTESKIINSEGKLIYSANRRPCVEHCQEAHSHLVSEIGEQATWQITGVGAAIILDNLVPHFVTTAGLQAVADNINSGLPKDGRGRTAVDATIIRLKRLGWHIPPGALEHFRGVPAARSTKGRFVKQDPVPA
jgi:hypothetical protein